MTAFDNACQKTIELFRKNGDAASWSDNLIEASRGLKTQDDRTRYYKFLCNPLGVPRSDSTITLTNTQPVEGTLPEGFEEIITQNGPSETIVHIRRIEVDEEKSLS